MDNTSITMSALKANFAASLDLLADVVRNPAFKPEDVERKRSVLLARIAEEKTEPQGSRFECFRRSSMAPRIPMACLSQGREPRRG